MSIINKLVEKLAVGQISSILEKHDILLDALHGFRTDPGSSMALATFTDDVNNCLYVRNQVVYIFIDYKKVFDTLDYDVLMKAIEPFVPLSVM